MRSYYQAWSGIDVWDINSALKRVCGEKQKKKKNKMYKTSRRYDIQEDAESCSSVFWFLLIQSFTDIFFQTSYFVHHKKKLISNSETVKIVKIFMNC